MLGAAIPDERAHNGWVEGVAIWIAVLIVISVGERGMGFRSGGVRQRSVESGRAFGVERAVAVVGPLTLHPGGAGAGNDYQKDQQFRKLNSEREAVKVKVVRAGHQVCRRHIRTVVMKLHCWLSCKMASEGAQTRGSSWPAEQVLVDNTAVVVGDVLVLDTGDKVSGRGGCGGGRWGGWAKLSSASWGSEAWHTPRGRAWETSACGWRWAGQARPWG